jgi:cysteinyl-tRNA synthetase
MTLKVYNTRTGKLEPFETAGTKKVKMFICGPTVWDSAHLGHARTYTAFDTIIRFLRFVGYEMQVVVNITDIHDSVINQARALGKDAMEMARQYEQEFIADIKALGINTVSIFAPASEFIPQIIRQIQILLEGGIAYERETAVYFDVSKSQVYGGLSRQTFEELSLRRLEPDPMKRNPPDFSLWQKQTKDDGPVWDSPWGKGRPGWHIEDTAIAMNFFGSTYDIHGGGVELVFPHHDAEIAQAEAATGQSPYVRYWLHSAHLMVDGMKMSKSLGNSIYIRDILKRTEPDALRFYFAKHHYRVPMNYSERGLAQAQLELDEIRRAIKTIQESQASKTEVSAVERVLMGVVQEHWEDFVAAMEDDFDTPRAVACLRELCNRVPEFPARDPHPSGRFVEDVLRVVKNMVEILGLGSVLP